MTNIYQISWLLSDSNKLSFFFSYFGSLRIPIKAGIQNNTKQIIIYFIYILFDVVIATTSKSTNEKQWNCFTIANDSGFPWNILEQMTIKHPYKKYYWKPEENGWVHEDGMYSIKWNDTTVLPTVLSQETLDTDDDSEVAEDDDILYRCASSDSELDDWLKCV